VSSPARNLEAGVELGAALERTGADVVNKRSAAGLLQRVVLQREVLLTVLGQRYGTEQEA